MRALDHKCPACGAVLKFNPKKQDWTCEYCDSSFSLEDLKKYEKDSDYTSNSEKPTDVYRCSDCGATLVADSHTSATHCVYCGNVALLKEKLTGKFAPKKVIPFKNTKEDVINSFIKLQKGRILMPKLFNDKKNIEKITGVYVPSWLFDVNTSGDILLSGNVISSWTSGDYRYTKTDVYELERRANAQYKNITLDGSSRFEDDYMHSIEPFEFGDLKDYNHAYLSGFLAEIYDKTAEERYKDAEILVSSTTERMVASKEIGFTGVSVKRNSMSVVKEAESYALLPVWMVNVKYKDKQYLFAVNGQTGKMIGNIPIDVKKAIILGVLVFALSFALLLVVMMFI